MVFEQNEDRYYEKIKHLNEQIKEREKEVRLYNDKSDHKEFYHNNYSRNNCIFNRAKVRKLLDNIEDYDFYHYKLEDYEEKLIDFIEREHWEEELDRLKSFIEKNNQES